MFLLFLSALLVATAAQDVCPGSKLKPEHRDFLLNAHNDFRSRIAHGEMKAAGISVPAAANMLKMEWDCELEASAQKWSESTDNCAMDHSERGKGRPKGVGENIAGGGGGNDLMKAMNKSYRLWAGEYDSCNFHSSVFPKDDTWECVGHTTQLAWHSTHRLGCGITVCDTKFFLVCHYGPSGNLPGAPIYAEGHTCSQCPEGTTCEGPSGLCVKGDAAPLTTTTTTLEPETTTTTANPTTATDAPLSGTTTTKACPYTHAETTTRNPEHSYNEC